MGSISTAALSPNFMTEPLPYSLSISVSTSLKSLSLFVSTFSFGIYSPFELFVSIYLSSGKQHVLLHHF